MKIIKKILTAVAVCAVAFGFTFAPLKAYAEGLPATPEITAETPENSNDNEVGEELSENTTNGVETDKEETGTTFEDFLTWSQKEAEKYGYGDEYAAAIEAIKAAATQEQVTLATIASLLVAVAVIAYVIYSKIKDRGFKNAVIELKAELETQRKGVNSLIDGENAILDSENKLLNSGNANGKTVEELKAEIQTIKRGFSAFISAFLRFADGIKLGDNKKTEVQTNCLNALKEIDGEVKVGENHEK